MRISDWSSDVCSSDLEAHAGAPKVVKALAEEYAGDDRVSFTFIWNDGAITDAREIKVEEVPDVDQAQAERIFREALEVARQEGRVDDELYSAFGGSQLRQDDAGRAANSGPEQHARNAQIGRASCREKVCQYG